MQQQMCRKCSEEYVGVCSRDVSLMEEKENVDGLSYSSVLLSSVSTFSENPMFDIVYKRKNQKASAEEMERVGSCPSVAEKDHVDPINPRRESETVHECTAREEHRSGEQRQKGIDVDSVNDSCSSKSAPLQPEVDETGDCSSSSVIIGTEGSDDVPSSEGLPEKPAPSSPSNTSISCSCKVCGRAGKAAKMLICDHCDEAFHLNCCNPRVKEVEEDEDWFCGSCLREKHILVKQRSSLSRRSARINCETSRSKHDELSPVSLMLQDTEPYTTSVRVGKGFQAEVPDWTGPVTTDSGMIGDPVELDPSENSNFQGRNSGRVSKLSTIGNWLQCKQVIDNASSGDDETTTTVCGKWRRAPLFEVQSENWECFCSVLWDPSHADCAVPQELETDEVMKQLKYIELLRPRLSAKRRRLGGCKTDR